MSTQTIRVSIVLPGKFSRHDSGENIPEPLKFCPCCGCELSPLLDKPSPALTSPPGGPDTPGPGGEDGPRDPKATRGGGAYCTECGTQLLYNDKAPSLFNGDLVTTAKPPEDDEISQTNTDSLTRAVSLTHLGKMLDEEYKTWEDRLQAEFQAFLLSVRTHFQKKEKNLQEYQIDLCQREKELQNSEEVYQQKIRMLKDSEEELKQRIETARESVSLQLENKVPRRDIMDTSVQTDPIQVQRFSQEVQSAVKQDKEGSYGLYIKSPPNQALKVSNMTSPPNPPNERTYTQEGYYPTEEASNKDYQRSGYQQESQRQHYQDPPRAPQQEPPKSQEPQRPGYNQSYNYSQKPKPQTKPSYQPHPGGAYSTYNQQLSPDSGYNQFTTYPQPKPAYQSPPFSQSPNSSALESPGAQSSSSNVPASACRSILESSVQSVQSRGVDQPDGGVRDYQHYHRSRLGRPPPPHGQVGARSIGYPQRYDRRSQSAEVLDSYPQRTQSPSPERETQRSFSADKVESPRLKRHEVPRSHSAERLLDNGYKAGQGNQGRQQEHQEHPPPRKQAPPYNGPPAYSKHAYNYSSPPPNHSRESSVTNGQGEGAIIESRTLEVQVARSKSVTDSLPSPKEKAVKFGVAVFPAKSDSSSHPKSPFPRAEGETEPDMTSTPVENKEVVFPGVDRSSHDQAKSQHGRTHEGYSYSQAKTQASRKASPQSRIPPGGYRYSATPSKSPQGSQIPEGAKPSPYSKYSTPPQPSSSSSSNLRRPGSATPNRNQIPQRSGGQRIDVPPVVQRRTPQSYPERTSKEINNNRPISDYADDEVFASESPPPSIPAKSPYSSSKLRPPGSSNRQSRNITSHHKSRIAQSSRSLSGSKNSNGIPRGIPQPAYHPPQQPEPQQPVRGNYGQQQQNNMAADRSNMAANTSNMAANTSYMAANTSNMAANTSNMAANTSNMAANTSYMAANTSNMAAETSNMADNSTLADDSLSSSILSSSKNRHFDFSPTYKALYNKYHAQGVTNRSSEQAERKRLQELERQHESAKSPTWRARTRLPNYGKYISEIQEVPVPTKILDH